MSHEVKNRLPVYIMHTDGDNNDDKLVVENGQGSEFFVINKESDKRLRFEDRNGIAYYSDYDVTNQIRLDLNDEISRSVGKDNEHDTKISQLTQNLAAETQNRITKDNELLAKINNISVPNLTALETKVTNLEYWRKTRTGLNVAYAICNVPDFTPSDLVTRWDNFANSQNPLDTNITLCTLTPINNNIPNANNQRIPQYVLSVENLPSCYYVTMSKDVNVTPHKFTFSLHLKEDKITRDTLQYVHDKNKIPQVINNKTKQICINFVYYEFEEKINK